MARRALPMIELMNFDKVDPLYSPKPMDLADFYAVDNARATSKYNQSRADQLAEEYAVQKQVKQSLQDRVDGGDQDISLDEYADALAQAGDYENAVKTKALAGEHKRQDLEAAVKLAPYVKKDAPTDFLSKLGITEDLRNGLDFTRLGSTEFNSGGGRYREYPDGRVEVIVAPRARGGGKVKGSKWFDPTTQKIVTTTNDIEEADALTSGLVPYKTELNRRFGKQTSDPFGIGGGGSTPSAPSSKPPAVGGTFNGQRVKSVKRVG